MNILLKLNLVNYRNASRKAIKNIINTILHNNAGDESLSVNVIFNLCSTNVTEGFSIKSTDDLNKVAAELIDDCINQSDMGYVVVTLMAYLKNVTYKQLSGNFDFINCDFMSTIRYTTDSIELYKDGELLVSSDDTIDKLLSTALTI